MKAKFLLSVASSFGFLLGAGKATATGNMLAAAMLFIVVVACCYVSYQCVATLERKK